MSNSISGDFNNVPTVPSPAQTRRQSTAPVTESSSLPRLSSGQIQQHYNFYKQVSSDADRLRTGVTPRGALAAIFGSNPQKAS